MKTTLINEKIGQTKDLPEILNKAIFNLYNVTSICEMTDIQRKKLKDLYGDLFFEKKTVSYKNSFKAYTLRYFPLNFYKIWIPLTDLLERMQIKTDCRILELGAGPGSATLGLIEFYKALSIDNPDIKFNLEFDVVETEREFLAILRYLFDLSKPLFPCNLCVNINLIQSDAVSFSKRNFSCKYDYIIESNLLNPNEKIEVEDIEKIMNCLYEILNREGEIIFIEPAKQDLTTYMYIAKSIMLNKGMTAYAPCSCKAERCNLLKMSFVSTENLKITNELKKYGICNSGKNSHYFEYLILNKINLKKYDEMFSSIEPKDWKSNIGKKIRLKAYIIFAVNKENFFDLKICVGTCQDGRALWIHVPKGILNYGQENIIKIGRGSFIEVKNAIITSDDRIECNLSTQLLIK